MTTDEELLEEWDSTVQQAEEEYLKQEDEVLLAAFLCGHEDAYPVALEEPDRHVELCCLACDQVLTKRLTCHEENCREEAVVYTGVRGNLHVAIRKPRCVNHLRDAVNSIKNYYERRRMQKEYEWAMQTRLTEWESASVKWITGLTRTGAP